jgi:hypothetical protein
VFASVCTDFGAKLVELDGEGGDVHLPVADLRLDAIAQMVTSPGRVGSPVAPAQPGRIHREHR